MARGGALLHEVRHRRTQRVRIVPQPLDRIQILDEPREHEFVNARAVAVHLAGVVGRGQPRLELPRVAHLLGRHAAIGRGLLDKPFLGRPLRGSGWLELAQLGEPASERLEVVQGRAQQLVLAADRVDLGERERGRPFVLGPIARARLERLRLAHRIEEDLAQQAFIERVRERGAVE